MVLLKYTYFNLKNKQKIWRITQYIYEGALLSVDGMHAATKNHSITKSNNNMWTDNSGYKKTQINILPKYYLLRWKQQST